MTVALHAELGAGRWQKMSLLEQMANIGSEVGRAAKAKQQGNDSRLAAAMDRCLELFDLTLADERWHGRRREIARARELVCDFLVGSNSHGSTPESLDKYFLPFAAASRQQTRAARVVPGARGEMEIRDPYKIADVFPPLALDDQMDYWELGQEWLADEIDDKLVARRKSVEARNRVRQYLAMNGAAVWARVDRALAIATHDQDANPAASMVAAMTAAELTIRYLLLRPLIAGFVFHTKLAMRLVREGYGGRTDLDRRLLPDVCQAWGIDLPKMQLPNGEPLWDSLESLIQVRNRYVHRAEPVALEQARGAVDCATGLVDQMFKPLSSQVDLAWPPVNWTHKGRTHDPVGATVDYMGS